MGVAKARLHALGTKPRVSFDQHVSQAASRYAVTPVSAKTRRSGLVGRALADFASLVH